jgi:hypothetical protein
MKISLLAPLCVLAVLAPFTHAQEAKTYLIKMERPERVGDQYDSKIGLTSSMKQQVLTGGKISREQVTANEGTLESLTEVTKVDQRGKINGLKITVKKFTITSKEEAEVSVPAGKVILANRTGDKKSFTIDGEAAAPAVNKMLSDMFSLGRSESEDKVSDDAIFGMEKPHAPGTEWDVDVQKMQASMPKEFEFAEVGSSGKMKFEKIAKVAGIDCAVLASTVKLKAKGMKGVPPESTKKAEIVIDLKGDFPLTVAEQNPTQSMVMKMDFDAVMTQPDGAEVEIIIDSKMSKQESRSPKKK